jgi:hypothetical protein
MERTMAEIDWDEVYRDNLSRTYDPFKAHEYTIYGRITGSKQVPPVSFSREDWYKREAPDYLSAMAYEIVPVGSPNYDPLKEATKKTLQTAKGLADLNKAAAAGSAYYGSNKAFKDANAYYNYLEKLYNQKSSAEQKIQSQKTGEWWKQYNLPDPSQRFASLESFVNFEYDRRVPGKPVTRIDANKLYKPVYEYFQQQQKAYTKKLRAEGVTGTELGKRIKDYSLALAQGLDARVNETGISPFLIAAFARGKSGR